MNDTAPDTISLRFTVAWLHANTGNARLALEQWRELLPRAREILGNRHDQTTKIDEQIRHWSERTE
ncbi:MAG: hypothetical protein ACRDQ5_05885 [Sciscionella sp.]